MCQLKNNKSLAKRYKDLRIDYDPNKTFTQQELADKLGITKTQISDLERGKKGITVNELKKYSIFFKVTTEYLLGLSNNKHHETYDIGSTLGLSDNAIKKLHHYNTKKDYNYTQIINFLIENTDFKDIKKIDRFLFAKPTHFLIRDNQKNEYKNSKYISVCSEMGDYDFKLDDFYNILLLDIERLFLKLQEKAKNIEIDQTIKEIETKDLNEWANEIIKNKDKSFTIDT